MPMFGGRGYSPRVSHPNYAGGLAQLGQTIGQGIQRGQQDAKFKRWNEGIQAVKEDSGGDENKILEALWRGSEIGDDPRVQAVMQNLIPQYQGVLDQRAAAQAAALEEQDRNELFGKATELWEAGNHDAARQLAIRQGVPPEQVNAAFPAPKDNTTADERNYRLAVEQGYPGTFLDYKKALRPSGDTILLGDGPRGTGLTYDAESQMEPKKDHSFVWVDPSDPSKGLVRDEQRRPKQTPLPGTEGPISESGVKLTNVQSAGERFLETVTPEMLEEQTGFFNNLVNDVLPLGGGNYLVDENFQIGRTAMSRFTESLLRQASGAATPDYEVERYRQDYSPVPGDKPETVRWKLEQLVGKVQDAQKQAGQDVTATLPEKWGRLWGEGEGAAPAATPTPTPAAPVDSGTAERIRAIAGVSASAGEGTLSPEEQRELDELKREFGM